MKKISILLFLLLTVFTSFGQIKFEYVYSTSGFDKAEGIVQTYDSGYAVIGSTEGFIGLSDIYLMKTDKNGILQWSKTYGGTQIDQGYDIVETKDSGFAIIGFTNSYGAGYDIIFIKTDENGDTIFTKIIGEIGWDFGYALKQTADGGYILAGETYKSGFSKGYAIKLDSLGNTTWKKTFGGAKNDKFEDVIITNSGSFVFVGETKSYGNGRQAYIVKTNNAGSLSWQKALGNAGIDFAKSVVELSNTDLVFTGGTNTPPYQDIDNWVVKVNSLGVTQQMQTVLDYSSTPTTTQNDEWNECVEIYRTDSMFFGGFRTYDPWEKGNVYSYLYTSDIATGYLGDFQKFIYSFKESIQDIKSTKDKGVIFACTAEQLGTGGSSIYLIKMDKSLTLPPPFPNSILYQTDISSVDEIEKITEMKFFPNPVKNTGTFWFANLNGEPSKIVLRNISGKIIETKKLNDSKLQVDFSSFANGIYFATVIQNNKKMKTIKIVVSK